jgi:lysozyme
MNDEGVKLKPYRCTSGKLTIGVGRNLDDAGITRQEALALLENDIAIVIRELNANVPWWGNLPEPASRGLANMCFNLGWPRLSEFRKMLGALEAGEFEEAADEALNSKWARQVGPRANRIAKLYRECVS